MTTTIRYTNYEGKNEVRLEGAIKMEACEAAPTASWIGTVNECGWYDRQHPCQWAYATHFEVETTPDAK